ncbi:hypothetical protein [Streptomyces sp. NBC_01429]|uniref:hypothetical protein n=1 Tax=Streptomyces sp. NBC_01429 TaxID=2903862 RepID=UPI002E2A0B9E|nr:hypothetical protein [Streptomyces sp. NBC_01429]
MADPGSGNGSGAGNGDLKLQIAALKKFRSHVDVLLSELEGGAAGNAKVAAQTISRSSLSGRNAPFAEADGLYSQYNRVHEALVSLSRTLGDQIEVLSIGVHAAAVGFNNVEEDVRRRYAEIRTRIDQEHEKSERRGTSDTAGGTFDPGVQ